MEHKGDCDTNCNWCAWYNPQRLGKGTVKFGNKRTSGDHPNYSIIMIGQNSEKSPEDISRLAVIQTSVEKHQLTLVWKATSKNDDNNKRKWKDRQIFGPYPKIKTKQTMEHGEESDVSSNWCTPNGSQNLVKRLAELEVWERIETTQTIELFRSARMLRRILEIWKDLLSLRLHWKISNQYWPELW